MIWRGTARIIFDFVTQMANPMAIAYMLGVPDRYPQNIRVSFDNDQFPYHFFNRNYEHAFSYDLPVASIIRFDCLKQAKLAGVDDENLYNMARLFIENLKEEMSNLQAVFEEHKKSILSDSRVLSLPEHEQLLNRLDASKTSVPHVIFEVIAELNNFLAREGFSFTVNPESLISVSELKRTPEADPEGDILMGNFAVQVINHLAEMGIDVPEKITADNVEIGRRNMFVGSDPANLSGSGFWFETKIHLENGTVRTYFIKSMDESSNLDSALYALKAFDRPTGDAFFVDMKFGKFDSFAVLETVGDIGADEFSFKSQHLEDFARVTGRAMGEAYMFGLSDRHFGNIRLAMDGENPRNAFNIDMDDAFDDYFVPDDIGRHLFSEVISPAKRFGFSDDKVRTLLVAFLQGLYAAVDEIQTRYSENPDFYHKLDKVATSPEWNDIVVRMEANLTSRRELIEEIITWLNLSDVTKKYDFNLNADEIVEPDVSAGASDMTMPLVSQTVEQLAYSILKDLEHQDKVDLKPQFSIDDIVIVKTNFANMINGGVEDRIVFEFTYPDEDNEQTSMVVKSIRYGDLEYVGVQALEAMDRSVYQCFKTDHLYKYYLGFYAIEHVGETDVASYVPASFAEAKQTAEYIGEAVAEGYMLGFVDRSAENVRLMYRDGRPVKAVNIDLSDALYPDEAHPDYLLNCLMVFIRNRINEGYTPPQITALIHSFMMGFDGQMGEMQEYYLGNQDELESYPGLSEYSRWETVLERLDPERNDTIDIQQKVVNYINDNFAQSIVSIASLQILALECTRQLKENGILPDDTAVSPETVSILFHNSDSLNVMADELALWFAMSVVLPDGGKHDFFVKSKMDTNDYSIPVFEALKALDRYPYTYLIVMQSLGSFSSFLVTDHIGEQDADFYKVTPQNAFSFAQQLGIAYGEAKVLGLRDRLLQNMRVIDDDGKPVEIVNIDFEDGFGNYEDTEDLILPVARLIKGLRLHRFSQDQLNRIMAAFLNGFAYSITQLQTEFSMNREKLLNHTFLSANSHWDDVLMHLDSDLYPIDTPLMETWEYLQDFTEIDISDCLKPLLVKERNSISNLLSSRLLDEKEFLSEPDNVQIAEQSLGAFVASQGFVPYTPEHASFQMDIDIKSNQSLFLKRYNTNYEETYHPGIMQKIVKLSRRAINKIARVYKNPELLKKVTPRVLLAEFYYRARMVTCFILYGKFSTSGIEIVENRLGSLVPPMIKAYYAPDGTVSETKIEGAGECIIQERMPYVLNDLFEQYKKTNDVRSANALLDKYFDVTEQMWRRGVFDTDLTMWKNYGATNAEADDVRVFDVSGLTDSRLVATYALLIKPYFERIPDLFGAILPEGSLEYFKERHADVFSLRNFNALWKTEAPVAAPKLNFADYPAVNKIKQSSDYEQQRMLISSFLASYDLAGRADIEGALLSLFVICNQDNSIEDIVHILGRPITTESLQNSFAVRDSQLMREINSMTFEMTEDLPDYASVGLLQLAVYEYMLIVLEKPVVPADISIHPREFFAYEHSI